VGTRGRRKERRDAGFYHRGTEDTLPLSDLGGKDGTWYDMSAWVEEEETA
jgi:hypothetical protein